MITFSEFRYDKKRMCEFLEDAGLEQTTNNLNLMHKRYVLYLYQVKKQEVIQRGGLLKIRQSDWVNLNTLDSFSYSPQISLGRFNPTETYTPFDSNEYLLWFKPNPKTVEFRHITKQKLKVLITNYTYTQLATCKSVVRHTIEGDRYSEWAGLLIPVSSRIYFKLLSELIVHIINSGGGYGSIIAFINIITAQMGAEQLLKRCWES